MTEGHRHRHLHIETFDSWWVRLLRRPLLHRRTVSTEQLDAVEASPYPYAPCIKRRNACWDLTALGILHRWTGLVLDNSPKPR